MATTFEEMVTNPASNPYTTGTVGGSSSSGIGNFLGGLLGPLIGGASIAGGSALTKSAYDRLGDIGEQAVLGTTVGDQRIPGALEMAQSALDLSQFRPFTVTSATGGTFGVKPPTMMTDPVTGQQFMSGTEATLGLSPEELALQKSLFADATTAFQDVLQEGGTAAREQGVYDRIRAVQEAEEQRRQLALEERLASQGRLGVTSAMYGGTPEQLALSQAQETAKNQAALMAMEQAQAEQLQQANIAGSLLGASYIPQAQMINVQQAAQLFPQLQQQAQLFGAGQYGETMMSGLEARLIAEQARANLLGGIGSGILGGMFSPVKTDTGIGSLFGSLLGDIFG